MISPTVLARIGALWSLYEQAGNEHDVHPALLASIDYRECDNDPNRSALSGKRIGEPNPDNPTTTVSKIDSLEQAAAHVKEMAQMVYSVVLTADSRGDDAESSPCWPTTAGSCTSASPWGRTGHPTS